MSCEKCEKAQDENSSDFEVYYYRIGKANIGINACREHAGEAINRLNAFNEIKKITNETK